MERHGGMDSKRYKGVNQESIYIIITSNVLIDGLKKFVGS
jgi:hypothetical protein